MTTQLEHWLIVNAWDAEDDDLMDVEHHKDCPTESRDEGTPHAWTQHTCGVAQYIHDVGLGASFQHVDDPSADRYAYVERVPQGRHLIEIWEMVYRGHESTEYDGGLRVIGS